MSVSANAMYWTASVKAVGVRLTAIAPLGMSPRYLMGKLIADDPVWKRGVHIKKAPAHDVSGGSALIHRMTEGVVLLSELI